jgi:hypothetical protein
MGFKPVTVTALDIKKQKGVSHEGTYKGSQEIDTQLGKQIIWQFSGDDGIVFGIYGFTNLNRAMSAIETGALVKITYTGTQKVDTRYQKQQDVHQVQVEVWTDEGEEKDTQEKGGSLPF